MDAVYTALGASATSASADYALLKLSVHLRIYLSLHPAKTSESAQILKTVESAQTLEIITHFSFAVCTALGADRGLAPPLDCECWVVSIDLHPAPEPLTSHPYGRSLQCDVCLGGLRAF